MNIVPGTWQQLPQAPNMDPNIETVEIFIQRSNGPNFFAQRSTRYHSDPKCRDRLDFLMYKNGNYIFKSKRVPLWTEM